MMNVTSSLITGCIICMGVEQGAVSEMLIKDVRSSEIVADLVSTQYNESYAKKYRQLHEELLSYKELKDNWDGYNGTRPSDEIISTVENFLEILQTKKITSPEIMLSGIGEVAAFWKNKKDYIEVSFDMKDHLTFFYTLDSNFYGEDDISLDKNIPLKLHSAISYFKNETSSKETKTLIKSTKYSSNNSLIEVA